MVDKDLGPLDVTVRGPGDPEVAVVGGIHGDERSGIRAVRRLRDADLDLQRGVAFVLANSAAIEADKRYIDSDLNRAFPGDPNGDREDRIAARLCAFIEDMTSLSLHETKSRPTPFALIHSTHEDEFELASRLPVPRVVDHWGVNETTITTCGVNVEIELAYEDSEWVTAAAEEQVDAFLKRVGALSGEPPETNPDYFHMAEPIPKLPGKSYELYVENFEHVSEGSVFASVDGRDLIADESFYPILMSEHGSPDIFGYKGYKIADSLEEIRETWLGEDRRQNTSK